MQRSATDMQRGVLAKGKRLRSKFYGHALSCNAPRPLPQTPWPGMISLTQVARLTFHRDFLVVTLFCGCIRVGCCSNQAYFRFLEDFYGRPTHDFAVIDGMGHNATAMFGSKVGLRAIFKKGDALGDGNAF